MSIEPLLYLIAHAPAVPAWFEPEMPTKRPDYDGMPPDIIFSHSYYSAFIRGGDPKWFRMPESDWLKENAAVVKAAADWDIEWEKRRQTQWPAAWAKEQLKQISIQFPAETPDWQSFFTFND